MSIWKRVQVSLQYVSEAVNRIFSPRDDDYPATGVQPFKGDRYNKKENQHDER